MKVGKDIKVTFIVYPRGYKPGDKFYTFGSFKKALKRAIKFGCDSEVVVKVKEETSKTSTSLFSPYSLVINVPYSDHINEINKAIFKNVSD